MELAGQHAEEVGTKYVNTVQDKHGQAKMGNWHEPFGIRGGRGMWTTHTRPGENQTVNIPQAT